MCQARNGHSWDIGLWMSIQPKDDISVWWEWRLSDKKCPLSRRAFKGVRFCDRRRYWRSSHSLSSVPNFIAMTPRLYNILGAITISLYLTISKYLAISNNIYSLSLAISDNIFTNLRRSLMFSRDHIIVSFNSIYTMDKRLYLSVFKT